MRLLCRRDPLQSSLLFYCIPIGICFKVILCVIITWCCFSLGTFYYTSFCNVGLQRLQKDHCYSLKYILGIPFASLGLRAPCIAGSAGAVITPLDVVAVTGTSAAGSIHVRRSPSAPISLYSLTSTYQRAWKQYALGSRRSFMWLILVTYRCCATYWSVFLRLKILRTTARKNGMSCTSSSAASGRLEAAFFKIRFTATHYWTVYSVMTLSNQTPWHIRSCICYADIT